MIQCTGEASALNLTVSTWPPIISFMNKKLSKFLMYGFFGVLGIVMIGFTVFYLRLSHIIEAAIETFGPKITQTTVKVKSVNVSPFSGVGTIRGFVLGNPKGFKTESAIKFSKVRIELDPKSVLTDVIVINKVLIEAPEITWEGGFGNSNLVKIQKNVEQFSRKFSSKKKKETSTQKKILIRDLVIKDAKVNVSLTLMGGNAIPLILPEIHLKNIGGKDGGSVAEVSSKILRSITGSITKGISNSPQLFKNVGAAVKETGTKLFNKAKGLFGN